MKYRRKIDLLLMYYNSLTTVQYLTIQKLRQNTTKGKGLSTGHIYTMLRLRYSSVKPATRARTEIVESR